MLDVHLEKEKIPQNKNRGMYETAVHDEPDCIGQWKDSDPLQGMSPSLGCTLAKGIQDIFLSVGMMKLLVHIFSHLSLYLTAGIYSFCTQPLSWLKQYEPVRWNLHWLLDISHKKNLAMHSKQKRKELHNVVKWFGSLGSRDSSCNSETS